MSTAPEVGLLAVRVARARRRSWCLVSWLGFACSPELAGPVGSEPPRDLELSPPALGERVSPVLHLRGTFGPAPLPRLFEGELSEGQLTRADDVELPSTLASRAIPLWQVEDERGQLAVPLGWLHGDRVYTLLMRPRQVQLLRPENPRGRWLRHWPGAVTRRVALYCLHGARLGGAAAGVASTDAQQPDEGADAERTEPKWSVPARLSDGTEARWEGLAGTESCTLLRVTGELGALGAVSPLGVLGVAVEPTVFDDFGDFGASPQAGAELVVTCEQNEAPFGLGCAQVMDDRIVLRGPAFETLWTLSGSVNAVLALKNGGSGVIRGFVPGQRHELDVEIFAADGTAWSAAPRVHTAEARPHVVLNEVLANSVGPEPAQEWVEITNDGATPVDLGGYQFDDGSAAVPLPEYALAPGQYALLVSQAFSLDAPGDVAPAPKTVLLRLPSLGKAGLSNSGEPLRLLDPDGRVVSRFPALAASKAGVSWARVRPDAPDDDPTAFQRHSEPGASPGAPNVLQSEVYAP